MRSRMRRRPAMILGVAVALMMVLTIPTAVFAEDEGSSVPTRVTKYFNVDVQVNENNSYEFTETVGTVFNTEGHGIYRYVPTEFDGIQERVDSGWCSTDPVELYEESGNYVLQMGSGSSYIFGDHEFKYGYTMTFRDDRDESGDYMYIDVLPTNWQTAIESSDITIEMPKKIQEDGIHVYMGQYGTDRDETTDAWELENGKTIRIHAEDLGKGVGITVLTRMPEGYWVGQEDPHTSKNMATGLPAVLALLFGGLWTRFGRRQEIVETVEFHPPEGITPAEIGLMIDGVLDKKDMVSMFVYFAQKGYMKIEEKKKKEFTFTKLGDIDENEKRFARILFDGLFERKDVVKTKNMGHDFADSYWDACRELEQSFGDVTPDVTKRLQRFGSLLQYFFALAVPLMGASYMLRGDGYIFGAILTGLIAAILAGKIKKSYKNRFSGKKTGYRIYRILLWAIDIAALIMTAVGVGSAFESVVIGALYFLCFGACQYFTVYCGRLSDKAARYMGQVLGLRNFIQTAEVDRIEALVEEDPEYFYSVLPYAYVMGLTNKWIKKFENINIPTPDWYQTYDSYSGHYVPAVYIGDSMGSMTSVVTTSVRSQLPSDAFSGSDTGGGWFSGGGGGGGFSGGGGGFSGGGGGGGGGGFW